MAAESTIEGTPAPQAGMAARAPSHGLPPTGQDEGPPPHPRPVAFFDLDKTLIDADAGVLFGSHILALARLERRQARGWTRFGLTMRYGAFLAEVLAKAVWVRVFSRLRLMKRSRAVRTAYTFFRGQSTMRLNAALEEFFDRVLSKRVYPAVERVLAWHRAEGHATVLITTGMRPIAQRYAKLLGIDHVVACELIEHDGRLTGEVRGPLYGADKAAEAERLAAENGWALDASYAYTDHVSDLHLLEIVGNPRPVHPDARLQRIASKRGWDVFDFRDLERSLPVQASV